VLLVPLDKDCKEPLVLPVKLDQQVLKVFRELRHSSAEQVLLVPLAKLVLLDPEQQELPVKQVYHLQLMLWEIIPHRLTSAANTMEGHLDFHS
jgi:hypothetical protein